MNLIDLPGILDSRGSEQEIVNAYTNSHIFKKGRSFKMMLLVEANQIYDRKGLILVETIERLEILFGS